MECGAVEVLALHVYKKGCEVLPVIIGFTGQKSG